MSQDYSEGDDFDGFSDHNGSQVYIDDEEPNDRHSYMYDDGASESSYDDEHRIKVFASYLDNEASEAESVSESETHYQPSDEFTPNSLHKFMHLPLELRQMIWRYFCPDLSNDPRVYEISFCGRWPKFAAWVEDQSAPLRTVLAIHQETRVLGHKFAPHLIRLPSNYGVAPCNMERDIIMVDWIFDHRYCPGLRELETLSKAAPGLQNLAVRAGVTLFDGGPDLDRLYSLKNVFISQDTEIVPTRGLTWCLSDKTRSYHVVHQEDVGAGLTQDVDLLFYWPDPEKYGESGERSFSSRSFGALQFDEEGLAVNAEGETLPDNPGLALNTSNWGYEISRLREWLDPLHEMEPGQETWELGSQSELSTPEPEEQDIETTQDREREEVHGEGKIQGDEDQGDSEKQSSPPRPQRISVWPLARFMFDSGVERLEAMKAWQKPWDEWRSFGGSDRDEDEFWSDDDDPDSLDGFIAFDEPIETESGDDEEASSQLVAEEEDDPSQTADHHQHGLDSDDDEESSTEPGEPSRARHKNRAVVDLADSSEGEEEDDEDTAPQPAGSSNRRARARARPVPIDSEDDDDDDGDVLAQPSRGGSRRAAVLSSGSEDEEKEVEDDDAVAHQNGKATVEDEHSSSDSSSSSSDEEEPAPPPRMSLAKRLRLEAAQARAALAADDSDDDEDQDQDGGRSFDEEDVSGGDGMGNLEDDEEDEEEAW